MPIAGRREIQLPLDLFDRISRETPFITNLRPSGLFHMEQLFDAGGVPAVMKELARGGLVHLDERSVTGRSIGEQLADVRPLGHDAASGTGWYGSERIVFPLERPLGPQGGIAILRGNLAPDGAVIKPAAVHPPLMAHSGAGSV